MIEVASVVRAHDYVASSPGEAGDEANDYAPASIFL